MYKIVKKFLEKRVQGEGPLLLGLSGGPDSLALLHLLLECRNEISFNLHLAHVDHGWREESGKEAEELRLYAEKAQLPYHLHVLKCPPSKNREALAREARLEFFSEVYRKHACQALLLAHQADDQVETILKKVLEGAHPLFWGGMKEVSLLNGMHIWRPLLNTPKKELEAYIKEQGLEPFIDSTNLDPAFLRGRMRTQILPFLTQSFGKGVSKNILKLGKTMDTLVEGWNLEEDLEKAKRGPFGVSLTVTQTDPLKRSALVKKFLNQEKVAIPREIFDRVCVCLEKKVANQIFIVKGKKVTVSGCNISISFD
jgi:tRNA(Ile)-lysidine synthase